MPGSTRTARARQRKVQTANDDERVCNFVPIFGYDGTGPCRPAEARTAIPKSLIVETAMRSASTTRGMTRLVMLAGGTTFILSSCDPTLQATVEEGIINVSTSLLASVLQALLQAAQEANSQTAMLVTDVVRALA